MSGRTFTEMLARWRKYCGRFTTGLVGLLALLALDDITTGKEPSFLPVVADSRVGVRLVPDRRHHQAAEMEAGKYLSPAPASLTGTR